MARYDEVVAELFGINFQIYQVATPINDGWYLSPGNTLLENVTTIEEAQAAADEFMTTVAEKKRISAWVYSGSIENGSKAVFV